MFASLLAAVSPASRAQTVNLAGVAGDKALLVVDGAPPRFVATGQTHAGVKVINVSGTEATVETNGKPLLLKLGEQPTHLSTAGGPKTETDQKVVLTADGQGHFRPMGSINGKATTFLVDTGATWVAMGQSDARRIGLKAEAGQRVRASTANGLVDGYAIQLDTVRVGNVEVRNVQAVVLPQAMPHVLLGNSFLTRFQMLRVNDQLTLVRKP